MPDPAANQILYPVFGIPGDHVLGFDDLLVDSGLEIEGACTQAGAGARVGRFPA